MTYKNKTAQEYQREYYLKRREKILTRNKEYFNEYYENNKEIIKQKNLERYYYKTYNIKFRKVYNYEIVQTNFIISILND